MKLPLTTVPNQILRQVSSPITQIDTELLEFIQNLSDTLTQSETPGVGISAIQVGKPIRLMLSYFPENSDLPLKKWHKSKSVVTAYLNPTITAHSQEIYLGNDRGDHQLEGCLSIPKVWGFVWRYTWIDLQYQVIKDPGSKNNQGPGLEVAVSPGPANLVTLTQRFTGFPARVLQHEYDHLNGILFTDHILGKSPIKGFQPLKTHTNHLFFEVDDEFTPIENPAQFAQW